MKKVLLSALALSMACGINAQTIFSEDFNGGTTLPTGWAQYNVDGLTPAANVSFMGTDGWVVRDNAGENVLTSTSWYSPAGASDDWAVTPAIVVPATGSYNLTYDVQAPDASYPDGYQVYVSTTGNTVGDFTDPSVYDEAAGPADITNRSVSLAAYAGQTIYIAFRNTSNDMFILNLDNVQVKQLQPDDVTVDKVNLLRYAAVSTDNTLAVDVTNNGNNAVTALTIDWNDGTAHSEVVTVNIASGATASVNHPTAVNYASVVEKNIAVTITAVNGNVDSNPTDNAGTTKHNTLSSLPTKRMVIEEGTGTWCGWCTRGTVAMEYMATTYPDFIGIAVHNGDPMVVAEYDAGAGFTGFPGANVDRAILGAGVSQAGFETYYNERNALPVPAAINATISGTGADITIDASADFKTDFAAANYRLAVAIVEDGVTGTDAGYNQANYYAGGGSGAMGGYENLPDPVPAADMVYDHVARAILGGYAGQTGSVPATITDGTSASYSFTYTVPSTSDKTKMHAVVMLIDQDNGEIVNANSFSMDVAGINEINNNLEMTVYPNPATSVLNVDFTASNEDYTISVLDVTGKVVSTYNYTNLNGTQNITIPVDGVEAGSYIVSISTAGASYTQHVVIK